MRPLLSTKRLGVSFKMRPNWTRSNSSGLIPVVSFKSTQLAEVLGTRRVVDVTRDSKMAHMLKDDEAKSYNPECIKIRKTHSFILDI